MPTHPVLAQSALAQSALDPSVLDPSVLDAWIPAIIFMALSLGVGLSMVIGARILGVRSREMPATRGLTYESGEEPQGVAWIRFHPRYYVVALVFVLFDVEAAFVLPWALNVRSLGLFAIVEMFVFLLVLLLGWAYAVRKGALEWQ